MMRRARGLSIFGLAVVIAIPVAMSAQESQTITGHVSANGLPVRGATVKIVALDISQSTNAEGRYSFIVPSVRVRGQTVTLTASYLRFAPQSLDIELRGGSITRDFDLSMAAAPTTGGATRPTTPNPGARTPAQTIPQAGAEAPRSAAPLMSSGARAVGPVVASRLDSTALQDISGQTDLTSALAGRIAGLDVHAATILGGSSSMLVRGPKSIFGLTQPLVVVDGIIIDNSNLATASQRSGTGGFDYGTAIGDLNLEDIAAVQVLSGPAAAFRYGGRAANGVLLVTTKSARSLSGFAVSASQQVSSEAYIQLPTYQNKYGQGLGGKFAFFDGKGGGVNDGTDQSWGPALDGAPVVQASLTEVGRPEVRAFLPSPNSVSDYYKSGRTITTNAAMVGGNDGGQFRIALSNRLANGITPGSSTSRQSAVFTGSKTPSAKLSLSGDLQYYHDNGQNRPGTGFDESNPVSGFAHMPRSIDAGFYATRLRDPNGAELSWNYAGRNNPYFAALANSNSDNRDRLLGGAAMTYALSSSLSAIAHAGTDHISETRKFTVASGWMGGFPYYAGRGDFSTGGYENDDISSSQTNVDVALRATPKSSGPMSIALTAGVGRHSDDLQTSILGADRLVDTVTPSTVRWLANSVTNIAFGSIESRVRDYVSLSAGARAEFSTLLSGASHSYLYPSVLGSIDLAHADPDAEKTGKLGSFVLRGGWSKSGNSGTSELLQRVGLQTTSVALPAVSGPEITSGWEAGTSIRLLQNRVSLDATYYNDRSENLIIANGATYSNTGTLSNKGFEASVALAPIRMENGFEWDVSANIGKNSNVVEALSGGVSALNLAPPYGGVSLQARTGSSLGTLVGFGYLKDASGNLILSGGHPLPDSLTGPIALGSTAPDWIGGLSSAVRMFGFELSVLLDAHHGGKVFSASNMVGAVSGVLDETAVRPDTGLLISGTDYATGKANSAHVSTEDYYHALGRIAERWIYDASYVKLREVRATFTLPLSFIEAVRAQNVRGSIIARNVAFWAKAPNIDPESILSTSNFRGAEMGQLATARSIGFQLTLTP